MLAKDKEGQTIWHLAAWKNYSHVFQNLMEWAEKANLNQQEFKEVLLEKDNDAQTPWQSETLNNHPEVCEWVTKVIKKRQEQEELLKELFFDNDKDEQTIWHLAARSSIKQGRIMAAFTNQRHDGTNGLTIVSENGRVESLNTLWEWAKNVHLNENELKNKWLRFQDSRQTVWHLATHRVHITVLKKLWVWAREINLDIKEDLLQVKDVSG